jgi:hypothetical protein
MTEPHGDAETHQLMASIRRLKAALVPGIPRNTVIAELRKILESEGMENLLAHAGEGYFAQVLNRAKACIEGSIENDRMFDQVVEILNTTELDAALLSDDPNEQPLRLRRLMLEGPYRGV